MNVAIIGAGFTGLAAALKFISLGHTVTIFEREDLPGGLALGFKDPSWQWSLEKHYHHWFTNDISSLSLAKNINYPVIIKRPKTSVFLDKTIYQLDSPTSVLQFPKLSLFERFRMATVLGLLRYNPFWQPLEHFEASNFLPRAMGKKPYTLLWEPLFKSKFGPYMADISLAWFWARVRKRTADLAYPQEGFLPFAQALVSEIKNKGGKIIYNAEVNELKSNNQISINYTLDAKRYTLRSDAVIVTLPSFVFLKIAPQLPTSYKENLMRLKGIGAVNIVLRLKKQFLQDGTYWLNICEKNSPLMAVVEHTNFMDKKYYNNEHLVYLGNYLPKDHPYMKMDKNTLLKIYDPLLRKINPTYRSSLITHHLFTVPFAQPIIPTNYSKIIPPFQTPLKNVYLANMQQVYPWDRGTNYAIEFGEKVANLIENNHE